VTCDGTGADETTVDCASQCLVCARGECTPAGVCGNGLCESGEDASCAQVCAAVCGNRVCENGGALWRRGSQLQWHPSTRAEAGQEDHRDTFVQDQARGDLRRRPLLGRLERRSRGQKRAPVRAHRQGRQHRRRHPHGRRRGGLRGFNAACTLAWWDVTEGTNVSQPWGRIDAAKDLVVVGNQVVGLIASGITDGSSSFPRLAKVTVGTSPGTYTDIAIGSSGMPTRSRCSGSRRRAPSSSSTRRPLLASDVRVMSRRARALSATLAEGCVA